MSCDFVREMVKQIQNEDKKNKFLPYASALDEEASQNLRELKTYLGSAILLREVRDPLLFWIFRLDSYIELYGLKFSKEDHVLFVKIIYDLLTIPDLPFNVFAEVCPTLRKLLKKKKVLIPVEDLTLPWRPLFDLYKKVFWSSYLKQAILGVNHDIKVVLEELVLVVRYYFSPSDTEEIFEELRPMLCPFDNKAMKFGVQMLSWFLPLYNPPGTTNPGHKLWLSELMKLWVACGNNSFAWEGNMMSLMAWLALLNVGSIDWEEYIPMMYTRFLKIFKLPVYYKKTGSLKMSKILEDKVASWIVSSLGGGSKSQDFLDQLLKTLESYCHSANTGYWALIIKSFLKKLSQFFKIRVKRERFKEPFWKIRTPEHKKLTDEDIYRFVVSMQSVSMQAIFSPTLFIDFTKVFHVLATLRPDIVVPPLLERLYSTIDSVTEPHKFIAVLKCVRSIAKPMVTSGLNNTSFPDGKKHVIPLLFAVLPGIDPNDHQKCIVTMQFISTFLNMIPIIDCSSCSSQFPDMTVEEEELAGLTSQFEEFILQYMERIFLFIESAAHENVRIENHVSDERSKFERSIINFMRTSCTTVFGQLSHPIFMAALKKMSNYSMVKIFEREVAGYAVATMITAFAKVNGEETFKRFIPKLCSFILETAKNQDIKNEEILDNELLYKMLLLSSVVCGSPSALKPYVPSLIEVLDVTLHLKCKEGYELSSQLLFNILAVFSNIYPLNYYVHSSSFDLSNLNVLPLREWGKLYSWNNLDINWYTPSESEISLVEKIFWKFLTKELETIEKYTNNEIDITRDEIRSTLTVLISLFSCDNLVAPWESESSSNQCDSKVPLNSMKLNFGIKRYIYMPDGSNVYKVMIQKLAEFQNKLISQTDDTVSFILLSKIWSLLLMYDIQKESEYHERKEFLKVWKNYYSNDLGPHFTNLRSVLIEEVCLKHMIRWQYNGVDDTTEVPKVALLKLFELATSDYKPIQLVARNILQNGIFTYADNSFFIKEIVKNLQVDTTEHAEKFKSTLTLLKGRQKKWFAPFTQNYKYLKEILPAIVLSKPSEEPAVIKLLDELTDATLNTDWRFITRLDIPPGLLSKAKQLWSTSDLLCAIPNDDEMQQSIVRLENENKSVINHYTELISSLLAAVQNKNLQWRYETMASTYIAVLLIPDETVSVEVLRYYLHSLNHDLLACRKIAMKSVVCIMKMYKTKSVKEVVDPLSLRKMPPNVERNSFPGPRADNAWCFYKKENVPTNVDEWNEVRYSFRCHVGYYTWPKKLYLHSASCNQPLNNICAETLSDIGKEVDSFFTNQSNIDKLIEYLALEENKGESLRSYNIALFKYLFKIHGDRFFDIFRPHLESMLNKKEENYQRCAAEMFAGIIQGMKLWPFEKFQNIMNWCVPLLQKSFDTMTVETVKHWGSCVATALLHCDVNKSSFLLELLMEEPIKGDAAFKDCGRLYLLQSGVLHSWRLATLWGQLLEYIKNHLANQYQNLRERLGSVLTTIFETDIETDNWNRTLSPHVADFIDYLIPKLETLYYIAPNSRDFQNPEITNSKTDNSSVYVPSDADAEEAILLLKTVCKWCTNAAQRCVYFLKPEFFKLFPLFCFMENYDKDEELQKSCKHTLSLMSFTPVLSRDIPVFVKAITKVSHSSSWCAKCTGLDFLQIFAFHNLFLISNNDEWVSQIIAIILNLLEDNRCEVRQKAGEVLSGFIHHNIIKEKEHLIEKFRKMSRVSFKKKNSINIRHAGVIGLCSFISAFPYTVPKYVPPLFSEIRIHLNDPEPIPSIIRKTLGNFKRTHYANWGESKLQFTTDQLEIFTDIIIPPNHYA